MFSDSQIFFNTVNIDKWDKVLNSMRLVTFTNGFNFSSYASVAVQIIGNFVVSIKEFNVEIPPLSFVPDKPSTSSTRMIFAFANKDICFEAFPTVDEMPTAFLKSEAFTSMIS